MSQDSRYNLRGVSASKEDVHNAIKNIDKGLYPKAFCKIIPDIIGGDEEYCNIMHADGAGTKSSLAYLYWKETGDLSVWKGIAQDAIVMNLDDLLCVGATDNILLSSTIGRNKNLIPGDVIEVGWRYQWKRIRLYYVVERDRLFHLFARNEFRVGSTSRKRGYVDPLYVPDFDDDFDVEDPSWDFDPSWDYDSHDD